MQPLRPTNKYLIGLPIHAVTVLVENEMDLVDPKDNRRTKRERVDQGNGESLLWLALLSGVMRMTAL